MTTDAPKLALQTRLIHAGEPSPLIQGSVTMPLFQSATYEHSGDGVYHAVRYVRLNNTPNHDALHRKLADICEAEAALVTASGMAAITTALLSRPGRRGRAPGPGHPLRRHTQLPARRRPPHGHPGRLHQPARPRLLGGRAHPSHPRHLRRGHDQPPPPGRRPARGRRLRAPPRPRLPHRQHLRLPRQLPPRRAGLRPEPPQRHQVPQRPLGRRRGPRRGPPRPHRRHHAQAQPPGRLPGPARLLPPPPRPQDPHAARPPAEPDRAGPRRGPLRPPPPSPRSTTPASPATRSTTAPARSSRASAASSASPSAAASTPQRTPSRACASPPTPPASAASRPSSPAPPPPPTPASPPRSAPPSASTTPSSASPSASRTHRTSSTTSPPRSPEPLPRPGCPPRPPPPRCGGGRRGRCRLARQSPPPCLRGRTGSCKAATAPLSCGRALKGPRRGCRIALAGCEPRASPGSTCGRALPWNLPGAHSPLHYQSACPKDKGASRVPHGRQALSSTKTRRRRLPPSGGIDADAPLHSVEGVAGVDTPAGGGAGGADNRQEGPWLTRTCWCGWTWR
jgi:hypothetical protein